MRAVRTCSLFLILSMMVLQSFAVPVSAPPSISQIKHVIIIVEENHTFDNYFGTYPGANGLSGAMAQPVTKNSTNLVKPFMINTTTVGRQPLRDLGMRPSGLRQRKDGRICGCERRIEPHHGVLQPKLISYYWDYASQFVLLDNFYTSVMTNSLPNHLYLLAGQSGGLTHDARSGIVNFTSASVHDNAFYFKSIVDELDASHVTWKYYAGGNSYLNNWNPLPAFASFAGNQSRISKVVPTGQFSTDVGSGKLPSVSWIMPATDEESEHAPYDISLGQGDVVSTINTVMHSSYWNSSAIFLTWDDWGGWYDHVPPPLLDQFGYGFRVPCLIISPYARQGVVDHTQGDFTSFLKFMETVYSLPTLTNRDASANSLMETFDFSRVPRPPLVLPGPFMPDHYPLTFPNGTVSGSGSTSTFERTIVTSAPVVFVTTTTTITVTNASTISVVQSTVSTSTIDSVTANAGSASIPVGWFLAVLAVVCIVIFLVSRRTARTRNK